MVECEQETLAVDARDMNWALATYQRMCAYYANENRNEETSARHCLGCSWTGADGDE